MVDLKATDIVTVPVRGSFLALFEPRAVTKKPDADKKYQATLLIPPGTDMAPFIDAAKAAMIEKWDKVISIPGRSNPIKRCEDKPDLNGYEAGWRYINVKSNFMPDLIDQKRQQIIDKDRIWPGQWFRFHLTAYAWSHETGGKGVSFSLNSVQLVKDDDRLDGRRKAEEVFDAIDMGEADDPFNAGAVADPSDPFGTGVSSAAPAAPADPFGLGETGDATGMFE